MDSTTVLSLLQPSDYIQLTTLAVSAVIALWSAFIARSAARTSSEALKDQRTALRAQHRSTYFRAVVLDPVLTALSSFSREAAALLGSREELLKKLPDSTTKGELREAVDGTIKPFNALFTDLEFSVLTAVRAWGEDDLLQETGAQLHQLQDDVTRGIGVLVESQNGAPPVELLREAIANLLALLVRYDREPFESEDSESS